MSEKPKSPNDFTIPDWAPQPLPIQARQLGCIFGRPLTPKQVADLRKVFGLNVLQKSSEPHWYVFLFRALVHPFNILLAILATASGASGEYDTMGIMLAMVAISTILRFHQEYKSQMAAHSLLAYIAKKVMVERFNTHGEIENIEIPVEDLVPGDCVSLHPGDLVPADVVIYQAKDLYVSQASLTGEAIPVEKFPMTASNVKEFRKYFINSTLDHSINGTVNGFHNCTTVNVDPETDPESSNEVLASSLKKKSKTRVTNGINNSSEVLLASDESVKKSKRKLSCNFFRSIFGLQINLESDTSGNKMGINLEVPNMCFMGTCVVSGSASAVVQLTGSASFFGQMAVEIGKRRPQNAFQLGVRRISWIFFITMAFLVPPVLLLQGFLNGDWKEAFLFALSVAVGLTPEMLPMIVNTTLAKGAREMSRKKCIVKNLDAIVNLGGIDVLCTDKTGTLTKSVVTVVKHISMTGEIYQFPLEFAYLTAHNQSTNYNPLDESIRQFYEDTHGMSGLSKRFTKIDEVPFDFSRRRVSVLLQVDAADSTSEHHNNIFMCKGAVDEMLAVCSKVWIPTDSNSDLGNLQGGKVLPIESEIFPLTQEKMTDLKDLNDFLNLQGLRVIAIAYKTMPNYSKDPSSSSQHVINTDRECDLTFMGFIAFLDPPKESTKEAIENILRHNIEIKVLTGDSPTVCKKICEEINLPVSGIITATDLLQANNSDTAISELARRGTIFAKLTPLQKADIVRALKRNGNIVGFLGDGINDAPALTEADVGISVDTGTDIAKESADIILLEKDLGVVVDGVVIGRTTYGNTLKYIVMAVSSNFGNVFSILVASSWLPFPPMKPIHLLVQNLLYDISQLAIPWDHMDPEFLAQPHRWSMMSVLRFMVWMGPWSSVFDILTFVYMYFYFGIKTKDDENQVRLFQTTWFTVGLLTQTLIVHMIRTAKIPFIQSWASKPVVFMTVLVMGIGLALPYIPHVVVWLEMVELKPMVYPYVAGAIFSYCFAAQIAKVIYKLLFKEWF